MRLEALSHHLRLALFSTLIACCSSLSATAGVAATRLIFPDLIQAESVDVGYAVLNPLGEATEVTFTAYGVGGDLLGGAGVTNPVTLELGPRSQLARFPRDLFGFDLDSEVSGWMEVTSDSEEIKGFFITLEDGLDRIDGADASTTPATSFILMFPPGADPNAGILHLVNPGDAPANVTVDLLSAGGGMLDDADRVIPAHGKVQAAPADLVAEIENHENVYLKVSSDQPIAAYQSFRVGNSIAGLNGIIAEEVDVLYSPQLGTGPVINSLLQLVNAGAGSETLTLTARDESGALVADTGLSPQGAASNPRQIELAAGELFQSDMAAFFGIPLDELRSGWIEVRHQNQDPITVVGSILFGDSQGGVFNASLPLQSVAKRIHLYSHVAEGSFGPITWFTGLATLNTTSEDANVSVTVRDPGGVVTANGGFLLKAGQRVSKTLPEILPGFGPQAGGSIEVVSDVEIFSFSLFALADLSVLAAIPTQPFESIQVVDGSEPVGGVIQQPVIHIPGGVVLNPDGPLELIGDHSVIIEGDIVSDSSVTVRSPGGTVVISGRIDTTAGDEPAGGGIFKNGRKIQGDEGEAESPDIEIEASTIIIHSAHDDTPIPDDPGDIEIDLQFIAGTGDCTDGGSILLVALTIVMTENRLGIQAGRGCAGSGSDSAGQVEHSKNGGSVDVFTEFLEKGNPDEEALLLLQGGRGGRKTTTFNGKNAYGANGGDGGYVGLKVKGSSVEKIVGRGGRGGRGQKTKATGGAGETVISQAGWGGNGGTLDLTVEPDDSGLASLVSTGEVVRIYGRTRDGGPGGDATALPGNGGPGQDGGDGTALGGWGGLTGEIPAAPAFAVAGANTFVFDLKELTGNPTPHGGDATVMRGNGGNATAPGGHGGNGGTIMAIAGEALENHANSGKATVEDAANGGNGFSGCTALPQRPGGDGGRGGDIDTTGKANEVKNSGNGGNGARGTFGGLAGFGGGWNQKTVSGSQSIQGNPDEGTATNSQQDGIKGKDGCPTEGSPVGIKLVDGVLIQIATNQFEKFIMELGRTVLFKFRTNHLSVSVFLLNKDNPEKSRSISLFDPDFPDSGPFDNIGDETLDPGSYCIFLSANDIGLSYLALVGELEIPVQGSPSAQFFRGDGKVVQGAGEVIVVELDLTDCCDPGPRFDISGTVDNPTEDLIVSSMQFFDPVEQIFGFGPLDFPGSPGAPLGIGAGLSQGTYAVSLPDGTYDVRIRGSRTGGKSSFVQSFDGVLPVAGMAAQADFTLPALFPLDVTVTAEEFRSIFFRQGGVEVQSSNAEVTTLVPAGVLDVEVRRRIREDGTNFTVGELSWDAGQDVLVSPSPGGTAPAGGDSADYTFPDAPPLVDVTILVEDELGNPLGNVIVSWTSGPLLEAPDMTFFGARRTEQDGMLEIPMPSGTYDFLLEIP